MDITKREELEKAYKKEKDPRVTARMPAVRMVYGGNHTCRDRRPHEVRRRRKADFLRQPGAEVPQQQGDSQDWRHNKARLCLAAQRYDGGPHSSPSGTTLG